MSTTEWIALAVLVLNFAGVIAGLTWGVSRVKDQVKDHLTSDIEELKLIVADAELKMERRTGEVGQALREKIVQVEFFIRDNYVREKEFDLLVKTMTDRFDRLQDGMDRLNQKIDKQILASATNTPS